MARPRATEPVAPIRRSSTEDFIVRYMARADATEHATSRGDVRQETESVSGEGGVAFGYGRPALSDHGLRAASHDIQRLFDEGHTVMKTVVSFDEDYLRRTGIVPKDFTCTNPGDYRGRIDQMKLRLAIMRGLERMGSHFDDLRYVGVIQVDTMHVHCHLAMVDAGTGTRTRDGSQRGKITSAQRSLLRRGIDSWLDEHQVVAHMSSAVATERRNVTTFVKRWAHSRALDESGPQLLLACLPQDRSLWRYGSHDRSMARANRVARSLVEEVLASEESPMETAMVPVRTYAASRRKREGLTRAAEQALVDRGRERIIERCVNGVYQVLQSIPQEALHVRTPVLDVMGMDYEELVGRSLDARSETGQEDPLQGFATRLRSYSARVREHDEQRQTWRERASQWEAAHAAGLAHPESVVFHQLCLEEEDYHSRCAAKYRHLLGPLGTRAAAGADWQGLLDETVRRQQAVVGLTSLINDRSLGGLKDPDEAERLGRETYGQAGGRLRVLCGQAGEQAREILRTRLGRLQASYASSLEDLRSALSSHGMQPVVTTADDGTPTGVGAQVVETDDFEDNKGLDLHDVRRDSLIDLRVGLRARSAFIERTRLRSELVDATLDCLRSTGQEASVPLLPVAEVEDMRRTAEQLETSDLLRSRAADMLRDQRRTRRSRTVSLDESLMGVVRNQIEHVVAQSDQDRTQDDQYGTGTETDVTVERS